MNKTTIKFQIEVDNDFVPKFKGIVKAFKKELKLSPIKKEDINGIPLEDKKFILELSRKSKKNIAKKWDEYFGLS